MLAVSDLALIMLAATDESFAHEGMSPHFMRKLSDWLLWVPADYGDGLGRRDVEPRVPVLIPRLSFEMLRDDLLPPRKPVPSAHWGIMADEWAFHEDAPHQQDV